MTCSYSVHKVMLKLRSWLWTRPTCWISFIKLKVFLLHLVHRYGCGILAQNIHYSGDSYWKGLATHLSNLCYGMLQEGQHILHVRWISQVENIVSIEGCNYPIFSILIPLHTSTPSTLTRTWTLLEKTIFQSVSTNCMVGYGVSASHCEKKRKC